MGKIALTRKKIYAIVERDKDVVRRWLNEIGVNHNGALSPHEIEQFFKRFGNSEMVAKYTQSNQGKLFG